MNQWVSFQIQNYLSAVLSLTWHCFIIPYKKTCLQTVKCSAPLKAEFGYCMCSAVQHGFNILVYRCHLWYVTILVYVRAINWRNEFIASSLVINIFKKMGFFPYFDLGCSCYRRPSLKGDSTFAITNLSMIIFHCSQLGEETFHYL